MRPLTLTINGQVADLPASTKGLVKLSQARAALGQVDARIRSYSFPFTLPATRANAGLFGVDKLHPQSLGKFGPYTDYASELRAGGESFAGTFRLTSLRNGYTGTFIGEGISWNLLLGDSKLTDLVFTPVAYDGSQLEQVLGKNCDASDVQFPLVAYGNFFSPPTTQIQPDGTTKEVPASPAAVLDYPLAVDDYPPSVYYVNVLRAIFASIGWQVQGRELDSDFWRSVVMLPAGADVNAAWNWGTLLKASQQGSCTTFSYYAATGANYSNTASGFDQNQDGEVFYLPLAGASFISSPTRALAPATASFTAPRNGVYSFEWEATLTGGHQLWAASPVAAGAGYYEYFQPIGLGLVLRRGGQDYTGADGGLCTGKFVPNQPGHYAPGQDRVLTPQRLDTPGGSVTALHLATYQGSTGGVYLETGDVVQLATFAWRRIVNQNGAEIIRRQEFVTEWAGISFACTHYEDDNGVSKELLQPADFLPPLSCKEVVREFLQRTNSYIIANPSQRVATIVSQQELTQAAGPPVNLAEQVDLRQVEYGPAATGSFVFAPVALSDDPLVSPTADVVTATIGPGDTSQAISSLFAVVGFRPVQVSPFKLLRLTITPGNTVRLPTCSTTDGLSQNRSEVAWDIGSTTPRLLRYLGPDSTCPVPFGLRTVPLGRAAWDGVLAWDGETGAVGTYYQGVLRRAVYGHAAKFSAPLSPALYRALAPGRRVYLGGAVYTVESVSGFDVADEVGSEIILSREA